jgi:serine phosphatase RsbU (regulator of sigma subunit)
VIGSDQAGPQAALGTAGGVDAATVQWIVARQPVGTLVIAGDGTVRFANPAAAALLQIPVGALVGAAFGFPHAGDGVTDINVAGEQGSVRTLAMQVTPLPGAEDGSALVSLFDVSGRARRYEHEHRLVESLQRSLLTEQMPAVPGVSLAARYLPGARDVQVGGDWYDAIPLDGGRLAVTIGDVAGHGIESAALMGRLRNALRAYAIEGRSPAGVLESLDRLVHRLEPHIMATLTYLVYDPSERRLVFASAGHPFPLLVRPGGEAEFLQGGRSPTLGADIAAPRREDSTQLPSGSLLVLYTDGLIERRTRPLAEGMTRLAESAQIAPSDAELACQTILEHMLAGEAVADDVAVLVMRTS